MFFRDLAETAQGFYFAIYFSKQFPGLSIFKQISRDTRSDSIIKVWSSYLELMKSSLYIDFFVNFEICIRLIAEFFIKDVPPKTSLNEIFEKLVEMGVISEEGCKLILILIYTCNTSHYSGIRTKETISISYEGNEFQFEKGKPVAFLDFDGILYLIEECITIFAELVLTEKVKNEKLINHPSSNLFIE